MAAVLACIVAVDACGAAAKAPVEFIPRQSDAILLNPHMGLYLQHPPTDATADEWFMKASGIAYYRLDWSAVNPAEDVLRFDEKLGPLFDFWVRKNRKRVAFRIMSQSPHSSTPFVTPAWVYEKGVPFVRHKGVYGQEQSDPVFWDERYLAIQCRFIRRLGAWLEKREGLEFLDIGALGCWGEMHLGFWTAEELENTGFTETKWVAAYRRIIDAYKEAFPRTPVFINVGGRDHLMINDYAAASGMHFRQDGLKPDGASYNVEEWLYPEYARRGVMCNFEFYSGLDEMREKGWDLKGTIEKGLSAPVSYMNTNLFSGDGYRQAPPEAIRLLTDAARRLGYRFLPAKVEHAGEAGVSPGRGTRILVRSEWKNTGVAPSHDSFAVTWSLLDASGNAVASDTVYPANPTNRWWPGETQTVGGAIRLPAGTAPGTYRMAVAMAMPGKDQPIGLGIEGRDSLGRYLLDSVNVVKARAPDSVILAEGFEKTGPAWETPKGVKALRVEGGARIGKGALRVEGALKDGWNYAWYRLPTTLAGGARYRLSGWMLVEKMEPSRLPPYLKIGVNDSKGRWLTNIDTNHYDMSNAGKWQKLTAVGDLPLEAELGEVSVEKGDNATAVSASFLVDDVALEMVEGP
jgi:hypothetical protein